MRRSTSTTTADYPAHQEETEVVSTKQAGTPQYRSKAPATVDPQEDGARARERAAPGQRLLGRRRPRQEGKGASAVALRRAQSGLDRARAAAKAPRPCAASCRSPSPPARPQRRLASSSTAPPPVVGESARLLDRRGRPRGARIRRPLHRRRPASPVATSGGNERRGSGGGGRRRGEGGMGGGLGFRPLRRP
jgi:hypothetical protein